MSDTRTGTDECLASWCADDEWCAVTCAMEAIGKKWHPVIVHRLLAKGPLRFNDLSEETGAVTNKVLSESLDDLEGKGLVDRTIVNDRPLAVEYSLTERGRSLAPVIDALQEWGREHLRAADSGGHVDRFA